MSFDLTKADLIITANQRQALDLQRQLRLPATRVVALSGFVDHSWQALMENGKITSRRLSAFEQQTLWQRVVSQEETTVLKQDAALAKACMDAWSWLHAWQIPLSALVKYATINSDWFVLMLKRYRAICQEKQWSDSAQALTVLAQHAVALSDCLPKSIVFYRFWQMPPALSALQHALFKTGLSITIHQPPSLHTPLTWRFVADSIEQEWIAMVQWMGAAALASPKKRFACVVPDLAQHRSDLEHYLQRYLPPSLASTVHFSLGKPLIDYPLVQAAWRLINLNAPVSVEALTYLSHSPFWLHGAELEQLVSQWRSNQLAVLPHSAWSSLAAPDLQAWWLALQALPTTKALPSVWQMRWRELLTLSAWPLITLNHSEQAVQQCFESLMQTFAELDDFLGPLTQRQALSQWQALLHQAVYEPPALTTPRIYFLGMLEALGSSFDGLWLSDVTQYRWPKLATANALIPKPCQVAYQLPDVAQSEPALWQAFMESCGQLIVSHAKWRSGLAQHGVAYADQWPLLAWQPTLEPVRVISLKPLIQDDRALALIEQRVPGGTSALKSQAHCPFQALARYRVGLHALPVEALALTAIERGVLVHHALATVWSQLMSQQALLSLDGIALNVLIQSACQYAIKQLNPWRKQALPKTLLTLEQQRLEKLLGEWLALEATRPAFTVEQTEQSVDIEFQAKTWRLRPDRIDRLAGGEWVLIDYKTGLAAVNWQTIPLLEPQLPFYILLNPQSMSALAVARVTARVKKIHGLAEHSLDCGVLGQISGSEDWSQQLTQWASELQQLAQDYIAGRATVKPIKGAVTCASCDLPAVCRITDPALNNLT